MKLKYFAYTPKNASYVNAIQEKSPYEQILLRKGYFVF
jgi:hypothetical protein